MTRDLLSKLKENTELMEDDGEGPQGPQVVIQMNTRRNSTAIKQLNKFKNNTEEVYRLIEKLKGCTETLEKIQLSALSAGAEPQSRQHELEDVMAAATRIMSKIRTKLKEVQHEAQTSQEKDPAAASTRMKVTQSAAVTKGFAEALSDFHKAQIDYRDKCKSQIKKQLETKKGSEVSDEELDKMLEDESVELFVEGAGAKATELEKQALRDVKARHAEIVSLEKSILELRDLFIQMAGMVEEQGELIGNIERQVCATASYVDEAKVQLTKAKQLQSSSRKKKIMCFIFALIVLIIIIVVLVIWLK